MKKLYTSAFAAIASLFLVPSSAFASSEDFVFTYDYEGAYHDIFGVQRNVQIDAAMLLKQPSLVGFEILGISVDVPSKTGCECAPVASAWLTGELKTDGEFNLPDIQQANGTIKNYGTENEPQLRLDITFPEPYTLTDEGVYVGYSLTVTNCNVPGTGWIAKYPIVTVCEIDKPQSFMVHTTKGESTLPQKYPEWTDVGKDLHQALAMKVIMRGELKDNAASLEPLQTLYVAPGTTGHVFTNLNNYGKNAISSIEYSYTFESEGQQPHTVTESLTLEKPVNSQIGAYSTLDLPFKAPETTGEYSVTVRVEKVNGVTNGYDGESVLEMDVVPFLPVHRPLVEDYTGFWCRYCPAVYVAIKQMYDKYGHDFIPITYHAEDALQSLTVEEMPSSSYGLPKVYMGDRAEYIEYENLDYLWSRQCRELAPADIEVELFWENAAHTAIRAESKIKFLYDHPDADYMVAYALVEDGMSDASWRQTNDFSDADYKGPYWDLFCGKGTKVSGLVYDDVVLKFPSATGIKESLPSSIVASEEYRHSSVLTLDDIVCQYKAGSNYGKKIIKNPDMLRVVAVLIDGTTGNVCNAATTGYSKDAALSGIESPELEFSDAEVVSTEYYTIDGIRHDSMPEKGVVIVARHLSDGSVITEKMFR